MSGVVDSGRELGYDNIDANEPELPFGRASEFATGAFPLPIALPDGERVRVRGSHLLGAAKKSPSTSKIKEAYDAQCADDGERERCGAIRCIHSHDRSWSIA